MTGWVCLMYHDVTEDSSQAGTGKDYFSVSATTFGKQLDQLHGLGFRVSSVEQVVANGTSGPRRLACSFDDGDAGQFTRGFPALANRGMSATFFVTTDWVGRPGYVSWEGLREATAAGMSIQSHTRSHPFLSELSADAVREELHASRSELDSRLGQRTISLALPGGDPPRAELRRLVTETGYSIVATSRWGVNRRTSASGTAWIHRCTIRGATSAELFRRIAEGDPWLAAKRQTREAVLRMLRASLGPARYARWRREWLNAPPHQEAT